MIKSSKELLEETERLKKENLELQRQLDEAKDCIDAIKAGNVDALVVADQKKLKIYTEKTADKTYRILVEKMNEGAVTVDRDGTILYANSCFSEMVNMPLQKVIGTQFKNFIDKASEESFADLFKKGWNGFIRDEVHIHGNDKIVMPVLMSVNSFPLDETFVLSIILTDLTNQNQNKAKLKLRAEQLEEKTLELEALNKELAFQNEEKEKRAEELNIANKELAFQNKEKEKRTAELKVANKDLTTFTYVSSHDLQEPLRKIQNFISVLLLEEEKNLTETGKGYFLRIRETAKRMQALIEDLLAYSRTKSGERVFENTNLNVILDEVAKDLEDSIKEKNATIEAKPLGNASVIPFQFRQIFQNLISNSLKFADPARVPHITVESELIQGDKSINKNLSSKKKYRHIIFTDNGIGFDPKYQERIFEVFQRLHTFDKYKGTGIGLAICKRIVENHHGIITATGNPGKGSRFDIFIPVT